MPIDSQRVGVLRTLGDTIATRVFYQLESSTDSKSWKMEKRSEIPVKMH